MEVSRSIRFYKVITAAKKPSPASRPGSRVFICSNPEARHHVLIFFSFERAGRVDQPPIRAQNFERILEHLPLTVLESGQILDFQPPLDLRIMRQRACSRARRVQQNAIELRSANGSAAVASSTTRAASRGTSLSRHKLTSQATTRAPIASACAVLFPGAAHKSSIVIPGSISSRGTMDWAPISCCLPVEVFT